MRGEMIFMVGWFAGGTGSHRRWAPRQEGIKACLVASSLWRRSQRPPQFALGFLFVSLWLPFCFLLVSFWLPFGLFLVSFWFPFGFLLLSLSLAPRGEALRVPEASLSQVVRVAFLRFLAFCPGGGGGRRQRAHQRRRGRWFLGAPRCGAEAGGLLSSRWASPWPLPCRGRSSCRSAWPRRPSRPPGSQGRRASAGRPGRALS